MKPPRPADERIPLLLQTPAAVRFVSCEPLLGALDLSKYLVCEQYAERKEPRKGVIGGRPYPVARFRPRAEWVIVGAESGPHARPMDDEWVRSLRDQCQAAGVAFWFKQRADQQGHKQLNPALDGQIWHEWPHASNVGSDRSLSKEMT